MLDILKIVDKADQPAKSTKKKITESTSVAINVTGDQPNDVLAILDRMMGSPSMKPVTPDMKLDTPPMKPVTPAMMPQGATNLPMVKTLADVGAYADEAAATYAKEVGEEWKNSPEPTVADTEYMIKDLAGGMNRPKKQFRKEYPGDNPMAVKEDLADQLMAEFQEIKEGKKIDEISLKKKMAAYAAARHPDADYEYGDKVYDQGDRIRSAIVRKHGEKAGQHADSHAHADAYGRSEPGKTSSDYFKHKDKLTGFDKTKTGRVTKSGTMNKSDQKYNATAIKKRLGTHTKPNLPEGF